MTMAENKEYNGKMIYVKNVHMIPILMKFKDSGTAIAPVA